MYLLVINGREHDGPLQFLNVHLVVFLHIQEIDEEVLQSLVLGAELELLALEYQNGLQLVVDVLCFELCHRNVICDAEFEHVQNMIREESSDDQIVLPFLLMRSKCK